MDGQLPGARIGPRLRELRLERGIQQADLARQLGVSPAYLNLIEKGKRTVQLPLLWTALSFFGLELEPFMHSLGEQRVDDGLARLLDEPLLRSLNFSSQDLASFSAEPRMATTIAALFNLYKNTRAELDHLRTEIERREKARLSPLSPEGHGVDFSPFDEVTDFLEAHRNYFPVLEEQADRIRTDFSLDRRILSKELVRVLTDRFGIDVESELPRRGSSVVRRFDPGRGRLVLSPNLLEQPLKFQLAHTIGLRILDEERLHERIARGYPLRHVETLRLVKIHLANYFAGALLMPYGDFFREVTRTRYDVERLAHLFEMSYEAVAHRICNLGDPKRPGLPMHFLRCDIAGNISKKYSGTGLRFPQNLGSCPKWAAHLAFLTPSVITRQYSMMPDGTTYFCFAKVTTAPHEGSLSRGTSYSIGLGTHADAARHLAYAADLPFADPQRIAVPVGVTCRFCERADCNQRATPSYKFPFSVDEYTKKDNFFSPLLGREHEREEPGAVVGEPIVPPLGEDEAFDGGVAATAGGRGLPPPVRAVRGPRRPPRCR